MTSSIPVNEVDIRVQDETTLVIFWGISQEGLDWLEEHLDPDTQPWGSGFVVEHRYAQPILEGAGADGLVLAPFGPGTIAPLRRSR